MTLTAKTFLRLLLLTLAAALLPAQEVLTFDAAQSLLHGYCGGCHRGNSSVGRIGNVRQDQPADFLDQERAFTRVSRHVRDGTMPPSSSSAPTLLERRGLVAWIDGSLKAAACADGVAPGPPFLRRLKRGEYTATVQDLLGTNFNAGQSLPEDDITESLTLSSFAAERYLSAAHAAVENAMQDPKARAVFLTAPKAQTTPEAAARRTIETFLPRAFRRTVDPEDVERYFGLFRTAIERGEKFEEAILYPLIASLASPRFLFLTEEAGPNTGSRPLGGFELASRLSYFLWSSLPDQELFSLAAAGKLNDPAVLSAQVARMLKDSRARRLAERFAAQSLDAPQLEGALHETLVGNQPLSNLLDAVSAAASQRTSSVTQRGKWITERILGGSVWPHPLDLPKSAGEKGAVCAACHAPIEELGARAVQREQLKAALVARASQFMNNLATRMLGYALGRPLRAEDACAADQITAQLSKANATAHSLVHEIVLSVPFRYAGPPVDVQ